MILIDGKLVSQKIKDDLKEELQFMNKHKAEGILAVIQVGEDPASSVYVKNKVKACEYIGLGSLVLKYKEESQTEAIISIIEELNTTQNVCGILVQLPLPRHINEKKVIEAISPDKDVDCFHPVNVGKMYLGEDGVLPCTPTGIMVLLDYYDIPIEGKNCVVVGRSNIVGKPMAQLLLRKNGTVTICHSRTENLQSICSQADILIVAVGKKHFITSDFVKPGATVIDVGIHRNDDGTLSGDVDFNDVKDKVHAITPVPGGVGPMTIALLMQNCVNALHDQII